MARSALNLKPAMMAIPILAALVIRIARLLAQVQPAAMVLFALNSNFVTMVSVMHAEHATRTAPPQARVPRVVMAKPVLNSKLAMMGL